MNRHQEYLLMLLKEIDGICKRNDIQYFIYAGTLIGAKRNEGFLPWDDDVDVCMTYENYVKFKEACATQLPENRAFCAPELQETCGISLPRYTSLDTTSFHTGQSLHDGAMAGEVVDIFVLDPIADGDEALEAYRTNVCMTHEMVNYTGISSNRYDIPYEVYQKYAAIREEKGKLTVCQQLEEEKKALFDENGSRYAFRWQGCMTCYDRSWFAEAVPVKFEGYEFPGPNGANEYLSHYFGIEWAELPGSIDPAKHNAALSLDFSYKEALEHYKPSHDRDALRAEMIERKRVVMEASEASNWLGDEVIRMRAKCYQLELEKHLAAHQDQFNAAYEAKDGATLAALLADYLTAQNAKELIGRHSFAFYRRCRKPVLIDVPDQVFEAALIAFMHTKRLSLAGRFLRVRMKVGKPLSAGMNEVLDQLKLLADATNDFQYGDFDSCLAKAQQLWQRDPKVSAYLKLICLAEQKKNGTSPEFKVAFDEGLAKFSDDGFFVKMQADYLCATGDEEKAHDLYLVAAENSSNGFVLHDIELKTGYCPRWIRESVWGQDYGVPQWDGPVPDCQLPAQPKPKAQPALTAQEYLYNLLAELADLCEKHGIKYTLAVPTASALFTHSTYPDKIGNYGIVVAPGGIEKITAALEAEHVPGRTLEGKDVNPNLGENTVRYHGDDSLLLRMGGTEPEPLNSLYATIKVCDKKFLQSVRPVSFAQRVMRKLGLFKPAKAFLDTEKRQDSVDGHAFSVSKGLKLGGKKPKDALVLGANEIASATISAEEFLAAYPIAPDFFEKRQEVKGAKDYAADVLKRSRENFKELKYAVQYKQLSFDLLPQKERILQLQASGNTAELAAVLKPYAKFVKAYKGCGSLNIDDEIYAAFNSLNR